MKEGLEKKELVGLEIGAVPK